MARLHQSVFNNMNSSQIVKAHALRCVCRRATAARNATQHGLRPLDPRTRFEPAAVFEMTHLQKSNKHDCCMPWMPATRWSQLRGRCRRRLCWVLLRCVGPRTAP
jgi:hypothetical protein